MTITILRRYPYPAFVGRLAFPQDSLLLFEGTISENIALNDPQASNEAIINAATIACAHEFIMSLPDGYATKLSEKGGNLSGGQRQRIAIARTILSNPQLLVMDEATSALDYQTESVNYATDFKTGPKIELFFLRIGLRPIKIVMLSSSWIKQESLNLESIPNLCR